MFTCSKEEDQNTTVPLNKMMIFVLGSIIVFFNSTFIWSFTSPAHNFKTISVSASMVRCPICTRKKVFSPFPSIRKLCAKDDDETPLDSLFHLNIRPSFPVTVASSLFAIVLGLPAVSFAAASSSPDWGIFEGKIGSLLHPAVMGALLLFQISTAIKGFSWRRQRTIGDEISSLRKKRIPPLPEGAKTLQESVEMMKRDGADDKDILLTLYNMYKAALDVDCEVNTLIEERKVLASQNNRENHFNQGAILVFLGTLFAIEGPLNTYARAGKLFPGLHLYAGAGLVVCWAAAMACVPYMQKGSETARSLHIGANAVGMVLFAWQVTSGIPILLKVWELTKWP